MNSPTIKAIRWIIIKRFLWRKSKVKKEVEQSVTIASPTFSVHSNSGTTEKTISGKASLQFCNLIDLKDEIYLEINEQEKYFSKWLYPLTCKFIFHY